MIVLSGILRFSSCAVTRAKSKATLEQSQGSEQIQCSQAGNSDACATAHKKFRIAQGKSVTLKERD